MQAELSYFQAHLATLEGPAPTPPPPPPQSSAPPVALSINDLPIASSTVGFYDMSSFLEPMVPPSWTMQPPRRQMDPHQFMGLGPTRAPTDMPPPSADEGELQELARELMLRPNNVSSGSVTCKIEGSSLPPHNR